jgi:CheY-like chemotaxis protein
VIADDDGATLRLYRLLLEQAGLRVYDARNGLEALRLVIDHEPDLVVTDVRLPLVSGLELVRRIRNHPQIKQAAILVVTALATDECRKRSVDAGCDRFLIKPTSVLDFLGAVRDCLAQESEGLKRA